MKVGIFGAAGYTGGEMIRLLIRHPETEILFAHSRTFAGQPVWQAHPDLFGETDLTFSTQPDAKAELVFFCLGHGESPELLRQYPWLMDKYLIDLSQDHRINGAHAFVYGLPEVNKSAICNARFIANPGCFATGLQLALLPLAKAGLLPQSIYAHGITGSTGAGQSLTETSHFSWRNQNHSAYKTLQHQHLIEVQQTLQQLQPDGKVRLHFQPQRGSFSRGIFLSLQLEADPELDLNSLYQDYYAASAFTHICPFPLSLKQVVNTNKCLLHLHREKEQVVITACLDNLLKGASGQAVQNMNLMKNWPEYTGLQLKANAY